MKLSRHLTAGIFAFAFAVFTHFTLQAQVVYTDISPDKKIEGWDVHVLEPDQDAGAALDIWMHPGEVVIRSTGADFEVMVDNNSLPLALEKDAVIDANATWLALGTGYTMLWNGSTGNWNNKTDKYLGLRFKKNGSLHYTWLRMDVDATPSYFILKDYAYNGTAGASILAGEGEGTTAGIHENEVQSPVIDAYPNPSNGRFTVRLNDKAHNAELTIFNSTGAIISRKMINDFANVSETLPKGVYVLQVMSESTRYTKQIVIY